MCVCVCDLLSLIIITLWRVICNLCIHSVFVVSFLLISVSVLLLRPCFNEGERLNGLQRGDAQFVDIIHTNVGILGIKEPRGDVDFFPNGFVNLLSTLFQLIAFCRLGMNKLFFSLAIDNMHYNPDVGV